MKSPKKPTAKPAKKPTKPDAKSAKTAKPVAVKTAAKSSSSKVSKAPAKPAAKPAAAGKANKAAAPKISAKGKVENKTSTKPVAKPAPKAAAPKSAAAVKAAKVAPTAKPEAPAKASKETKPAKSEAKAPKAPKTETVEAVLAKTPIVHEEPDTAEDVVLTDADGRRYCRIKDCDRLAEVDTWCRFHYILLWKNIQTRRHILQEGKLGRYIEELTARYPDKFLEILKKDLRSEKDFLAAIQELEIDESAVEAEFDDEESQSDIFEVQRMSDSGGGGRSDSDEDRF
ncbi:MAG: hypothetical protein JNJ49_01630 [Bdellovibrionaceae bacterium]|nr:hypothetical protein [Pseudobdellovibrionaceae bacterium]